MTGYLSEAQLLVHNDNQFIVLWLNSSYNHQLETTCPVEVNTQQSFTSETKQLLTCELQEVDPRHILQW